MNPPGLSVVIPSRDGAARLPETLASIARQAVGVPVEVVVVDDGSSDGTEEAARRSPLPWGGVKTVRLEVGRGRATACNAGLSATSAPLVLVLDDDMTLGSGALEAHRAFHAANPRSSALGRIVLPRSDPPTSFSRFLLREQANRDRQLEMHADEVPFPLCLTGHFSASRAALAESGGFDARIAHYGFEDVELGYRLVRLGIRLSYLPTAESIHRSAVTDLDRYLERHVEAGVVARQLSETYPEGPFREYLRLSGPRTLGLGRDPAGLVALRLANRVLLRRSVRRILGSGAGFAAIGALLRSGEALHLDRLVHFGYHVARDLRYFQGYFGERAPGGGA